jgi:hypothetical protein
MPNPCLNLSNYRSIVETLGSNYGERSENRPDIFSFQKTYARGYSGVRVRLVLDTGMEGYWIRDSAKNDREAIHLVMSDRSFMDRTLKTDFGMACFVRGMIYDRSYGTLPIHPIRFPPQAYAQKHCGLEEFMNEASLELQDFLVKNILFNLE